jgi:hypothetical protein
MSTKNLKTYQQLFPEKISPALAFVKIFKELVHFKYLVHEDYKVAREKKKEIIFEFSKYFPKLIKSLTLLIEKYFTQEFLIPEEKEEKRLIKNKILTEIINFYIDGLLLTFLSECKDFQRQDVIHFFNEFDFIVSGNEKLKETYDKNFVYDLDKKYHHEFVHGVRADICNELKVIVWYF